MGYRLDLGRLPTTLTLVLVGTGGTGSFVAEGICRLLGADNPVELHLVDPDVVEPHNLVRQNFLPGDIGEYKAKALALRLATRYRRRVAYSLNPFSEEVLQQADNVLIGCVDNHLARRALHQAMARATYSYQGGPPLAWVDSGNGEHWGQILVGTTANLEAMKRAFWEPEMVCRALPLPSLQHPQLLEAPQVEVLPPEDCAEAVEAGAQSPTINQLMATLVVDVVRRLLAGSLEWMGVYADLEHGALRVAEATPEAVARVMGMRKRSLIDRSKRERRT